MTLSPKDIAQIRSEILSVRANDQQQAMGVILWYDDALNQAKVLVSAPGSDEPGEVYTNVPCPVNLGVQGVGPEPGRTCILSFKSGADRPVVVSFFNFTYDTHDYARSVNAEQVLPNFMLEM